MSFQYSNILQLSSLQISSFGEDYKSDKKKLKNELAKQSEIRNKLIELGIGLMSPHIKNRIIEMF